ncbi:peptidylprolyl isomerase [Lacinutrix salivirga]
MPKSTFLLFLFATIFLNAQNSVKKEIALIEDAAQAEAYLETNSSKDNKLLIFNEEKHKTKLAKELLTAPVGSTIVKKGERAKTYYKITESSKLPHYRISYIYFDGTRLDAQTISNYKNQIFNKYKKGKSFNDLARRYSMAKNAKSGGDSGWLQEGSLPVEIENEAFDLTHNVDDIYTVRIPENDASYIIVKTHRIQEIKEIKVLKIVDKK